MTLLILGGAGSGKSAYAEGLLSGLPGKKLYIAAMEPFGDEALARIEKHRRQRAGKGFETVERYTDLAGLRAPAGCSVLLEDLGNLCANERYSPRGSGERAEAEILRGLERLQAQCAHLLLVSNEVFCGGKDYQGDTQGYLSLLARVNRRAAALADGVCEVVCGLPVYYKGEEPRVDA